MRPFREGTRAQVSCHHRLVFYKLCISYLRNAAVTAYERLRVTYLYTTRHGAKALFVTLACRRCTMPRSHSTPQIALFRIATMESKHCSVSSKLRVPATMDVAIST